MMRRVTLSALCVCICLPAHGYEDDVHYGLTKWLAMQAPLKEQEAEWIAAEAVAYDHSLVSATNLVLHYACLSKDAQASRLVQEDHFPGEGVVPGDPKSRGVVPGSREALRKTNDRINNPGTVPESNLRIFGEGLHPLEDSWSHQGEPDTPWRLLCKKDYAWGHPKARGGWSSHNADLTARYPQDAKEIAAATYDQICAFTKAVLHRECKNKLPDGDINAFINAKTKVEKRDWFLAHGIRDTSFLNFISLPDGRGYGRKVKQITPVEEPTIAPDSGDAEAFMTDFFRQWATAANLNSVAERFADVKAFRYTQDGDSASGQIDSETLATLLTLWRVRDHGGIAEQAHDLQSLRKAGNRNLLDTTRELSVPYGSLDDAFLPLVDADARPFFVFEDKTSGKVYGYARFRHAANDSLIVVASRHGDRFIITELTAIVEH